MEKTVAILAAGIGSRYGGIKQMEPVGPSGEFIIDYSIFDAIRAGFDKVIFIIRGDIEDEFKSTIGERIGERSKLRTPIRSWMTCRKARNTTRSGPNPGARCRRLWLATAC